MQQYEHGKAGQVGTTLYFPAAAAVSLQPTHTLRSVEPVLVQPLAPCSSQVIQSESRVGLHQLGSAPVARHACLACSTSQSFYYRLQTRCVVHHARRMISHATQRGVLSVHSSAKTGVICTNRFYNLHLLLML